MPTPTPYPHPAPASVYRKNNPEAWKSHRETYRTSAVVKQSDPLPSILWLGVVSRSPPPHRPASDKDPPHCPAYSWEMKFSIASSLTLDLLISQLLCLLKRGLACLRVPLSVSEILTDWAKCLCSFRWKGREPNTKISQEILASFSLFLAQNTNKASSAMALPFPTHTIISMWDYDLGVWIYWSGRQHESEGLPIALFRGTDMEGIQTEQFISKNLLRSAEY